MANNVDVLDGDDFIEVDLADMMEKEEAEAKAAVEAAEKREKSESDKKGADDAVKRGKKDKVVEEDKVRAEQEADVAEPRNIGDKVMMAGAIGGAVLVGAPIAGAVASRHKMQKAVDNLSNDIGAALFPELRRLPDISGITGLGDKDHQGYEP